MTGRQRRTLSRESHRIRSLAGLTSACRFVRGLENRIQALQKELAASSSSRADPLDTSERPRSQSILNDDSLVEVEMRDADGATKSNWDCAEPPATLVEQDDSLGIPSFHDPIFQQLPPMQSPASFVEELKILSLEATAERHLGSSSGLSFAKLTQTVLRRLNPDKAEFTFSNVCEFDFSALDHTSLPDLLDSNLFDCFKNDFPCYPNLTADLSLGMSEYTGPSLPASPLDIPNLSGLVEFYFAHSHTLYPIIQQGEFDTILEHMRRDPLSSLSQSSLCLFRIWMVLAIGSTAHCSVTLSEETESAGYYRNALEHFEAALNYGEMVSH